MNADTDRSPTRFAVPVVPSFDTSTSTVIGVPVGRPVTTRPVLIGAAAVVSEIDLNRSVLLVGPDRIPVTGWAADFIFDTSSLLVRSPPWPSCAWCFDPLDGRHRCWRCGHKHWWDTHPLDVARWNEYRRLEVQVAFSDGDHHPCVEA